MYARKTLSMAITAGLMFGIGACSMQEKAQVKQDAQATKEERTRQDLAAVAPREQVVDEIAVAQIEPLPPPAPPANSAITLIRWPCSSSRIPSATWRSSALPSY